MAEVAAPSPAAAPAPAAPAAAAPAPAAPAPTPVGTESVNPGAWQAGFSDDLRGYIGVKGFKDPASLADAYRNLEKLRGVPQERLLTLPEKFYGEDGKLTPEGRTTLDRIGAPKKAEEYGFKPPEGVDPKTFDTLRQAFFENGIPKTAAEKVVEQMNAFGKQTTENQKAAMILKHQQEDTALKGE